MELNPVVHAAELPCGQPVLKPMGSIAVASSYKKRASQREDASFPALRRIIMRAIIGAGIQVKDEQRHQNVMLQYASNADHFVNQSPIGTYDKP